GGRAHRKSLSGRRWQSSFACLALSELLIARQRNCRKISTQPRILTGRHIMANGTTVSNGVNVQALLDARDALTKAPEAALFKWRAACEWKNGTHSHSTVESFFGLGEEQHRKT